MRATQGLDQSNIGGVVFSAVQDHATLFLVEGILLMILGAVAIVVPPLATIAVTIIIGWVFLAGGMVGLLTTFGARDVPGFWWSLLSALIGVAAGVALLAQPSSGAFSLTLLLAAYFAIEGVATIMYALEHRRKLSDRWRWMLFSGLVDLVLAAIIFGGLPGTAAWVLGLLVGIDMIFGGAAVIAIAMSARRMPAQPLGSGQVSQVR